MSTSMTTNTLAAIRERADEYPQGDMPLEQSRRDVKALLAIVDALTARAEAAEAALRPFANVAQVVMKREPLADDRTYMSVNDNRITYGDLRTAADALAAHAGNADSGESGGA